MPIEDFQTNFTCCRCGRRLLRVPQSLYRSAETEPDESIICGSYEQVVEQGAGLIGGLLTQKQIDEIIEKMRLSP